MRGQTQSLLLEPLVQGEQQDPVRESILTLLVGVGHERLSPVPTAWNRVVETRNCGSDVLAIVPPTVCLLLLGWRVWASQLCPSWFQALLTDWEIG